MKNQNLRVHLGVRATSRAAASGSMQAVVEAPARTATSDPSAGFPSAMHSRRGNVFSITVAHEIDATSSTSSATARHAAARLDA